MLAVILSFSAIIAEGSEISDGIPAHIAAIVRQHHPDAQKLEYKVVRNNLHEARFVVAGQPHTLLLDQDGAVIRKERKIDQHELPASAREYLSKLSFQRIPRIMEIREGGKTSYHVSALSGSERYKISFDEGGKLLAEDIKSKGSKGAAAGKSKVSAGFSAVNKKWELPDVLTEVSGITALSETEIACVQDESGIIYIYDILSSKIVKEIPFAGPGDFEGIACVDADLWILRSDAVLFHVRSYRLKPSVTEYRLPLTGTQNFEGLCYDKKGKRLLLAPREFESADQSSKGIYSFDLQSRKLQLNPVFRIRMADPNLPVPGKAGKAAVMPSEIAIHPKSGEFYITDARNARLLVYSTAGKLLRVVALDKTLFGKTEGITFLPSGGMFFSNEGKKAKPNLLFVSGL
jgi:uncharacterized protein YjiK